MSPRAAGLPGAHDGGSGAPRPSRSPDSEREFLDSREVQPYEFINHDFTVSPLPS